MIKMIQEELNLETLEILDNTLYQIRNLKPKVTNQEIKFRLNRTETQLTKALEELTKQQTDLSTVEFLERFNNDPEVCRYTCYQVNDQAEYPFAEFNTAEKLLDKLLSKEIVSYEVIENKIFSEHISSNKESLENYLENNIKTDEVDDIIYTALNDRIWETYKRLSESEKFELLSNIPGLNIVVIDNKLLSDFGEDYAIILATDYAENDIGPNKMSLYMNHVLNKLHKIRLLHHN